MDQSGHWCGTPGDRQGSGGGRNTVVEITLDVAGASSHAPAMFVVTEEDETAIRAVYVQRGEFATAVELRQRFPGITDNAQARECARTIAGWKPTTAATGEADAAAITAGALTGACCRSPGISRGFGFSRLSIRGTVKGHNGRLRKVRRRRVG